MRWLHPISSVRWFLIGGAALAVGMSFLQSDAWPQAVASTKSTTASAAPRGETYVLRTYEVGDLVFNVPDYPYTGPGNSTSSQAIAMPGLGGVGGMGGIAPGPGPRGMSEPSAARITMDDLRRVLLTLVAPDSWEQGGGGCGAPMGFGPGVGIRPPTPTPPCGQGELQSLGDTLIVRQTPEVHRQIADLLEQLRQGSGRRQTVAVDARWLVLDSDDLDRLTARDQQGRLKVDSRVLAEFTRRPTSIRGLMNCFSGQLVYMIGGTRRNVVSSYVPVVGSMDLPRPSETRLASRGGARITYAQMGPDVNLAHQSSVGYQPIVHNLIFGMVLEIRPTLIPGAERAVVDLRSLMTSPGGTTDASQPDRGGPLVPQVEQLSTETQEMATTMSVPLGEPVLVGGLTYVGPLPSSDADSVEKTSPAGAGQGRTPAPHPSASNETPQLYLILELR